MKWRLSPPVHPLHLALGLLLWFLWFSLLYGGVAVACLLAAPPPPQTVFNAINVAGLVFTLVTAGLFGWACRAAWQAAEPAGGRGPFVARLAAALYAVAALATVAVGVPLLVVPPCV